MCGNTRLSIISNMNLIDIERIRFVEDEFVPKTSTMIDAFLDAWQRTASSILVFCRRSEIPIKRSANAHVSF